MAMVAQVHQFGPKAGSRLVLITIIIIIIIIIITGLIDQQTNYYPMRTRSSGSYVEWILIED